MNSEEIIKLARKAGFVIDSLWMTYPSLALPELLERFAALVAAKEREACAMVCIDTIATIREFDTGKAKEAQAAVNVCANLAERIRARGD